MKLALRSPFNSLCCHSLLFSGSNNVQGSSIQSPVAGSEINAGFTTHLIASVEVGLAIGLACKIQPCLSPESSGMGEILYTGPFHPDHPTKGGYYHNFTVHVPHGSEAGLAQINVGSFFLIGVIHSFGSPFNTTQFSRLQSGLVLSFNSNSVTIVH
ncbi:hypothetical protein C8J56DRAFT_880433 [Mycena floridula]|nr:hypothetical protein C8J56DRAFT_880433 [Mycena floridula]